MVLARRPASSHNRRTKHRGGKGYLHIQLTISGGVAAGRVIRHTEFLDEPVDTCGERKRTTNAGLTGAPQKQAAFRVSCQIDNRRRQRRRVL